ncbi:MAG: hypothetical protein DVB31_09980 [Verrucomicrobia bacterium]|nr:MAG: hypothetical protein DVB31_09980 [Verrucomicrobiota bacterium]
MQTLTPREQRTVRLAAIGIAVYLALFFGFKGFAGLGAMRADHERLVRAANALRSEVQTYQTRALKLQRLMDRTQLDPGRLSTNTVVAQTSAALQLAAQSGGLQLGAVRESVARSTEREMGTIQFEAMGQPAAVLGFMARLDKLGFPVVVESVQLGADSRGPGMLRIHLNLIVLDFEQWKSRQPSHA